jgi:hypothetical protein
MLADPTDCVFAVDQAKHRRIANALFGFGNQSHTPVEYWPYPKNKEVLFGLGVQAIRNRDIAVGEAIAQTWDALEQLNLQDRVVIHGMYVLPPKLQFIFDNARYSLYLMQNVTTDFQGLEQEKQLLKSEILPEQFLRC